MAWAAPAGRAGSSGSEAEVGARESAPTQAPQTSSRRPLPLRGAQSRRSGRKACPPKPAPPWTSSWSSRALRPPRAPVASPSPAEVGKLAVPARSSETSDVDAPSQPIDDGIVVVGASAHPLRDASLSILRMPWPSALGVIALLFLAANAVF